MGSGATSCSQLWALNWDVFKLKKAIKKQQLELDAISASRRDVGGIYHFAYVCYRENV